MSKTSMKPSVMLNPVPAVLVSCARGEEKNLITIAWTGTVNSQPPMAYISVRKSRHSHSMIKESGEFVINLVTEDIAKVTDFCGVKSGRDMDKFKECGLTALPAEEVSAPLVAESPVNLECKVKDVLEYPSHDMFIAEVVKVHADESLFDEDGRIRLDQAGLVCYSHGEYFGLKPKPLGKFGFSVMKEKTKKRLKKAASAKNVRKAVSDRGGGKKAVGRGKAKDVGDKVGTTKSRGKTKSDAGKESRQGKSARGKKRYQPKHSGKK